MSVRSAMILCLIAAPASAAFLHGNVSGNAQYAGSTSALPDALTVSAGFLNYRASPDLPQIADDLGSYSLALHAVALPGPAPADGTRAYRVTGGIWRNGVLAERLVPKPAELTVNPGTGDARLFLTLDFARPAFQPLDFRPANGFALDGRFAMGGQNDGSFTGKFVTASALVPEPGMVALFGLGALAIGRARRAR